jgi:uncharacterized protein involved in outer membrane biogenesis
MKKMKKKKDTKMKKLGIIVGIVVVVFVALLMFKNVLIKMAIERGTKKVTGLTLTIGNMDVGLLAPKVDIMDMKLLNPPGFSDKVMIDIRKFFVSFELASFFTKRAHFKTAELDLKELTVVRNKERKLNIDALTSVGEKRGQGQKPAEQKEAKQGQKSPQVTIDKLVLKIGKVIYKDYAMGETPVTQTFDIGINEVYRDVTDPKKLVNLIIVRALERTSIAQLTNFDMGALKLDASTLTKGTQKDIEAVGKTSGDAATKKAEKTLTDELNKQLKY